MAESFAGLEAGFPLLWEKRGNRPILGLGRPRRVQVQALLRAGLAQADLQLLIANGYLEVRPHRRPGQQGRPSRQKWKMKVSASALVVLTAPGAALASQILYPLSKEQKAKRGFPDLKLPAAPLWNSEQGILYWGEKVVERFRRPAPNLVALLNALQKHNWAPWTPNPFRATGKHSGHYLLREAIKNWNYSPMAKFIRLHGDGYGTGFLWERLV